MNIFRKKKKRPQTKEKRNEENNFHKASAALRSANSLTTWLGIGGATGR